MPAAIDIKDIQQDPHSYHFESVLWNIESHVLAITLNRPNKKNAINTSMAREIVYLLRYAKICEEVRVVIINASGNVFSAGGDLAAMRGELQETASTVPSLAQNPEAPNADLNLIATALRYLNKPSILKIEGSVFAGALLFVCNATHVFAVDTAEFSAPEIHRGLWPYMVMAGLFRLVPKRKGLDWIMTGQPISAKTAELWGLINKSGTADEIGRDVEQLLKIFRNLPPKTMAMGLEAFNRQEFSDFDTSMDYLSNMLQNTLLEGDAEEGISAFFDRRIPAWVIDKEET